MVFTFVHMLLERGFDYGKSRFEAVFRTQMKFPEKVCIVAPGPNGKAHYGEIPDDYFVIVVNKAALIDELKPDLWLLAHADVDWFEEADQKLSCIKVFSSGAVHEMLIKLKEVSPQKYYYYNSSDELLGVDKVLPLRRSIRPGASVSAQAVQLAFNMGAKELLLCGVDMSGNQYWDNTENPDEAAVHMHGDTWSSVKRFNPLIKHLIEERGIKVSTLSETQLVVPQYEPKLELEPNT